MFRSFSLPLYVGLRVIDFKTFKTITIGGGSKGAVGGGQMFYIGLIFVSAPTNNYGALLLAHINLCRSLSVLMESRSHGIVGTTNDFL